MKMFFGSLITFLLAIGLAIGFFAFQFLGSGVSKDTTEVLFDVSPGQSMTTVTQNLESQKLIKNGWLFLQYSRLRGMNAKLKKGEYALNRAMTPFEIMSVITSGKSVLRNFTVPEGYTIFDIADLMEKSGYGTKKEFLELVTNKAFIKSELGEDLSSLEGYLFPDTYKVTKFDSQKEITQQMLRHFLTVWKEVEPLAQQSAFTKTWSRHKIITFASIVEKETGNPSDRELVSSVFHNRLKQNMKLQTDPTVLYGKALLLGSMPNNITRADLSTPTPHNSYTNYGLPPTPISNPGAEAIKASLSPAGTKFLYFVSRNDGTTAFSETLAAHNLAVQKFQINSKNREGKSWRDLNKKTADGAVVPASGAKK